MRSGSGFRCCCRARNSRRARRPAIRACSSRPCSGGRGAGCRGVICRPNGLGPGTRCMPGFGAGAKPACGRGCWPRCKMPPACTGSWSTPRPFAHTKWRPGPKKRQPRWPGARPQPGRFHDQAPPELRYLRPDLRPGPDRGPSRRLPTSTRTAAQPLAGGAGRLGRPGVRCGLRTCPNRAGSGRGRDSRQEKPDSTNRTRC
jgi:hypothetical protein